MHSVDAAAGILCGTLNSRKLSGPRNTDRAFVTGDWWPQADSAARSPHAARLTLSLRVDSSVGEHCVPATKSGNTNPGSCAVGVDRTIRGQGGAEQSEEAGGSTRKRKRPTPPCFPVPVKLVVKNVQAVPLQSALQSIPGPTGPQPIKLLVTESTK